MAAGSNRPHHIHLHHNHIRLILQLILDAPPPQLIIAHPSSNLHQSNLPPRVAGIIDLLFNGDLLKEREVLASSLTDLLHLLLHQQAVAGVLVQVKAITSGNMVWIHRHQSLRRISEHVSPRVTNTRTSNGKILRTTFPHEVLDLDDLLSQLRGSLSGIKDIAVFGGDRIAPIGKIRVLGSILRPLLDLLLVGLQLLNGGILVLGDIGSFEDLEGSEANLIDKRNKARL
jgi:hypothetical protein